MTTVFANTTHSLAVMAPILPRLRERMAELGLALAFYDAQGRCVGGFEPASEFCRAAHDGCQARLPTESRRAGTDGGQACEGRMQALAGRVISQAQSAKSDLSTGCCLIGAPVFQRRRLLGAVVAAFPVREIVEGDAPPAVPERLARRDVRHSRGQADDFLRILEWMLEREQAVEVARGEIANLSANLATTYEELSLIYRISGQMEVTQSPREFFRTVCRELQEGMGIAAAAAVIYADRPGDEENMVVLAGAVDLNEQQIRLIASTQIVPRFAGNRLVLDNEFVPSAGSGVGGAIRNLIAAPLSAEGAPGSAAGEARPVGTRLMGMLIGFNKTDSDRPDRQAGPRGAGFDSVDMKLINSIADQGSVFLANSRLYGQLQDLLMGVLHALTASIDAKDPYTCGHSQRVALLSGRIAKEAGFAPEEVRQMYLSGLLHDVGKIGIPESVLCKPGRLTDDEYETIKGHPMIGSRILAGIRHLDEVIDGILTHHERPDGRGYPRGLRGEEIPVQGRIVGLADAFDAMTSDRTYRDALPLPEVVAEIRRHTGKQVDAELAEKFLALDLEQLLHEIRRAAGPVLPTGLVEEFQR